ncbi:MAG TPA: response regulator transcription factor [Verrucomicrobiae bacterium]
MTKPKTRVFLVDDHPIVRRGLQLLISLEPDLMVCGETESAPVAVEKVQALKADLVVVDLALKTGSGLELIKQLRSQHSKLKILVFSMRDEGIYAERALRAGANGYITKEEGTEKALEAIRIILQGRSYVSEKISAKMVERIAGGGAPGQTALELLSDRELEVMEMIGEGMGSREIAEQLHVSIKTVESHREHIKSKLNLTGASELVRYAINWMRTKRELSGPS